MAVATTQLNDKDVTRLIMKYERIEADLRAGEEFSQAIFNAAQTGLVVINIKLKQIMDVNATTTMILGYEKDELVGALTSDFYPPDIDAIRTALFRDGFVRSVETTLKHKDGHEIPIILSITIINKIEEPIAALSFLDITERKEAEKALLESHKNLEQANQELKTSKDQMVQSEKLASIGQLAAGVAHEINNPVGFVSSNLTTIANYADTMNSLLKLYGALEQVDPADTEQREALLKDIRRIKEDEDLEFILGDLENVLNESMEGVHRVSEIVQNLKSFAREDSTERGLHNINDGIEAMIKMVWNELKYNCEVVRNYGEIPLIQCHPGQINQVIMNILVNASHAMPKGGGTITVGTMVTGDEMEISIADTGMGIPKEVRNRIFDPFFTTKDVGKGTGLGLAISHGIIMDHGGHIQVDSEVGKGTTFRIYLPLNDSPDHNLIG